MLLFAVFLCSASSGPLVFGSVGINFAINSLFSLATFPSRFVNMYVDPSSEKLYLDTSRVNSA